MLGEPERDALVAAVERVAPARLGPERRRQIDLVDRGGGRRLRRMLLELVPGGPLTRRLADWAPFGIGRLELLNCRVGVHLHEPDPAEGRLASGRFALEQNRSAEWAPETDVSGAERSGKVVGPKPVCVGRQRHVSNVAERARLHLCVLVARQRQQVVLDWCAGFEWALVVSVVDGAVARGSDLELIATQSQDAAALQRSEFTGFQVQAQASVTR